jgi:[ribosomal protein S18]-alanine N-acetyltransferase
MERSIHWMVRADREQVCSIEEKCFSDPWTEEDFSAVLDNNHKNFGIVVKEGDVVLGFLIYQINRKCYEILNMAVDPVFHREYVGRTLLREILKKLDPFTRTRIFTGVPDCNTEAHLFLKSEGFRAIAIRRGPFQGYEGDWYRFCYRLGSEG